MLMLSLFRALSSAAGLLPWLLNMATRLVAHILNMPEPLVHSTGVYVFAQVQAAEHRAASFTKKSLCPARLFRQLRALYRRSAP
jgi:hypothetical protein